MNARCLYCDNPIEESGGWAAVFLPKKPDPLCGACQDKLIRIEGERCGKCSRPLADLPEDWVKNELCIDCIRWEEDPQWRGVLVKNTSIYLYNDFLKEVMARYKYRGDYILVEIFAAEMKKMPEGDLYVPIPLSEERLKERGFNQAAGLLEAAGIPPAEILTRKHSEKQSKKSRKERLDTDGTFQTKENITGKSAVLVDDIYTTGATLHAAAKTLLEAGAISVQSFTVARG